MPKLRALPSDFYYALSQEKRILTEHATGTIDMSAVLGGKSHVFVKSGVESRPCPKKLIIADWSACNWSNDKIASAQELFAECIDKGFSLYIEQRGEIVPLPREDLSSLKEKCKQVSQVENMSIDLPTVLAQTRLPGFTRDGSYLLDYYHLQPLLRDGEASAKRRLYASDYSALGKEEKTRLLSQLQQNQAPEEMVHDAYSETTNTDLFTLKGYFPTLPLLTDYDSVDFNPDYLLCGVPLSPDKLRNTTYLSITLKQTEGSADLAALLPATSTHLKTLLLLAPACQDIDLMPLPEKGFPDLERLALSGRHFTVAKLQAWIDSSPRLKWLTLAGVSVTEKDMLRLPTRLERLALYESPHIEKLAALLENSPRLKILRLGKSIIDKTLQLPGNDFPALEELNLSGSWIGANVLDALLQKTPHLKKLNLASCQIFGTDVALSMHERTSLSAAEQMKAQRALYKPGMSLLYSNVIIDLLKNGDLSLPDLQEIEIDQNILDDDSKKWLLANKIRLTERNEIHIPDHSAQQITHDPADADSEDTDSEHDPDDFLAHKPSPHDAPFQFVGSNRTKNQSMIIEKLSQYILLTGRDTRIIPELQDGICNALSHYFSEISPAEWEACIQAISAWNGKHKTLSEPLRKHCDTLLGHVQEYQLNPKCLDKQYLGEGLTSLLNNMPHGSSHVLENPWHAIAVKRIEHAQWLFYDPNASQGYEQNLSHDALLLRIQKKLGNIVGVAVAAGSDALLDPPPVPSNLNAFLQEGGLFPLIRCSNTGHILKKISGHRFSFEALEKGLFLRDTAGKPSWVAGIEAPHTNAWTATCLLVQFRNQHPQGPAAAKKALEKSMEAMSSAEKKKANRCLAALIPKHASLTAAHTTYLPAEFDLEGKTPEEGLALLTSYYREQLKIWETPEALADNLDAYTADCLTHRITKRLIDMNTRDDLHALRFALQAKAGEMQRPVFYIHTPEELTCLGMSLERDGYSTGKTYGGALHRFLEKHADDFPLLVINYDNFSLADFGSLNMLIQEGTIDTYRLPERTQIIGLRNPNKPDAYPSTHFFGRTDKNESCPIPSEALAAYMRGLDQKHAPASPPEGGASTQTLNLFRDSDWKSILCGKIIPAACTEDGRQAFTLQPGLLREEKEGTVIRIQNSPKTEDFELFLKEAQQQGGITTPLGTRIDLSGCSLERGSDGYAWEKRKEHFQKSARVGLPDPSEVMVLTPQHLHLLLGGIEIHTKGKGFRVFEGKISRQKGERLPVYLTRTLTEDQWAKLLTACQENGVSLDVQCAAGVVLPKDLADPAVALEEKDATFSIQEAQPGPTQLITSTDVDTTVALLKQKGTWDIYLDISELDVADLFTRVQRGEDGTFTEKECVLLTGLQAGKNILLAGSCSLALADQLASLLIERFHHADSGKPLTGHLCIVTHPHDPATAPFQYIPSAYQQQHRVTQNEPYDCLKTRDKTEAEVSSIKEKLRTFLSPQKPESLATLQARYDFLALFPEAEAKESDSIWENLERSGFLPAPPPFDPENSQAQAAAFHAARQNAFDAAFKHSRYVLLLGFSGVGKTTFVQGLQTEKNSLEIAGTDLEKSLLAWKDSRAEGKKRLFIDEATLHPSDWTRFESLFHDPSGILINGEYFELTSQHEVVFAGNPVSYSADRKAASLFLRHGRTLVFNPLPPAVLYEDVLRPLFENQPFEEAVVKKISAHFLEVYSFLVSHAEEDVPISPRELEMMALLTLSYCAQARNARANPLLVAKHYAYTLAKNLAPPAFRAKFDQQFNTEEEAPFQPLQTPRGQTFHITASRKPLCQKIDEWLTLAEWRRTRWETLHDKQRYGGLGGITMEGESGIGKSELILDRLESHGFKGRAEAQIDSPVAAGEKIFYRMQKPTRATLEKIHAQIKQGAIVVVVREKANACPSMEDLFNRLVMEGLIVICTQHPAKTTPGCSATSTASARRNYTEALPAYPTEEMIEVLQQQKALPPEHARALSDAFEANTEQAIRENRSPRPCFREVLRQAEETRDMLHKAQQRFSLRKLLATKLFSAGMFGSSAHGQATASRNSEAGIFGATKLSAKQSACSLQ